MGLGPAPHCVFSSSSLLMSVGVAKSRALSRWELGQAGVTKRIQDAFLNPSLFQSSFLLLEVPGASETVGPSCWERLA